MARRTNKGTICFGPGNGTPLQLPCGQCIGCRLERSRQWAVRIMHEASFSERNSFITLTYSDEHLPSDYSLSVDHLQRFFKRYRKLCGPLRYFACGEYGDANYRPHYHLCVFGHDFDDKLPTSLSDSNPLSISPTLSRLWPFGHSSIGALTFESAAYVARYCTKKVTGKDSAKHYQRVIASTGEIVNVLPEFARMSLKPAIGRNWYDKFGSEVYPLDRVIVRGRKAKPPRYYDKLYEARSPQAYERLKEKRMLDAEKFLEHNNSRGLVEREEYVRLKQAFYSRAKL